MDIIFIGGFLSEEESTIHNDVSQAACLYQRKFIDFTQPSLAISVLPIFINFKQDFKYEYRHTRFINNQSGLKSKVNYIYRLIFDTIQLVNMIRKSRIKKLVFYNLDYQNACSVCFAKYILNRKVYVIVADHVSYRQRLMDRLLNRLLKRIDGIIVLNSNTECNVNSKTIPGLLYEDEIELRETGKLSPNVLLSGSLGKTTGLELALDCFSNTPDVNLYITGKKFMYSQNEFDQIIAHYTKIYSNIKFLGLLGYKEYLRVMDQCDIAMSLRNPNDLEHNYNFPSKVLEYLSKSKMVLSTMRYKDIEEDLLFYSEYDSECLGKTIQKILRLTSEQIRLKRQKIKTTLEQEYTRESVAKLVRELVGEPTGY